MKSATYVLALAMGFAVVSFSRDDFSSFRKLLPEDEIALCGAGFFTHLECVSHEAKCVNGLVIGGTCQPGLEGVQCDTSRTDKTCDSVWGFFEYDLCGTTVQAYCPTGIILKCKTVQGESRWVDKGSGHGACDLYLDCY